MNLASCYCSILREYFNPMAAGCQGPKDRDDLKDEDAGNEQAFYPQYGQAAISDRT